MFRELWSRNVKDLLKTRGLSIAEAARLVGTSKQYLSTIVSDSEPTSTKEAVMERLCFLLHATPSQLFSPQSQDYCEDSRAVLDEQDAKLPPVELAILAERHFLAGEYVKAYAQCCGLLQQHENELGPGARAQALLLAGKSGCLAGMSEEAQPLLKEALRLFQKRLAAHPEKYIPLCMDCYRYMGLAHYTAGNYREAGRWLARVCALSVRYPRIAADLEGKVEEAVSNWLRSTVKQGQLSEFLQAASVAKSTADSCSFAELNHLVRVEELLCFYPLAVVAGDLDSLLLCYSEELNRLREEDFSQDSLQFVHYVLLLRAAGRQLDLALLEQNIFCGPEGAPIRAIMASLVLGQAPQALATLKRQSHSGPVALQALNQALQGLHLETMGLLVEAHTMWQNSLGLLSFNQEIPLYIYCLHWYLNTTALQLPLEERAITSALLNRAVASFAPEAEGLRPWK